MTPCVDPQARLQPQLRAGGTPRWPAWRSKRPPDGASSLPFLSVSDMGTFSWTAVRKWTAGRPATGPKSPKVVERSPNLCVGSTTPQDYLEAASNGQLRIRTILSEAAPHFEGQ